MPGELVLVGGGSDEQRLRGLAGERVRFEGPKDRDELVGYYRDADVFVLPSRSEPWGMVLNEAAAAGLPLVATEESGAAHDLVDGQRLPRRRPATSPRCATRCARSPTIRSCGGDGARSRELAQRFTPEAWADGVASAAGRARRRTGRR